MLQHLTWKNEVQYKKNKVFDIGMIYSLTLQVWKLLSSLHREKKIFSMLYENILEMRSEEENSDSLNYYLFWQS
jgi:hypothetical protein